MNAVSPSVDVPAMPLSAPTVQGELAAGKAALAITFVRGATQYVVYQEETNGSYKAVATIPAKGQPASTSGQAEAGTGAEAGAGAKQPIIHASIPVPSGVSSVTYRVAAQNADGQAVTGAITVTDSSVQH